MAKFGTHIKYNAVLAVVLLLMVGCSSMSSSKLLENPQLMPAPVEPRKSLVVPPQENLVLADPAKPAGDIEEMDLGPDVPSLTELSKPQELGIDAPKTAVSLEKDIQTAEIDKSVKWRGKVGRDGIDITNVQGILCTGAADPDNVGQRGASHIVLACSDGQVTMLTVDPTGYSGHVQIGQNKELVDLR